jgi:hypothetical protein
MTQPAVINGGAGIVADVAIHGVDPESTPTTFWTYSMLVDSFRVPRIATVVIHNQEKMFWGRADVSINKSAAAAFRSTPSFGIALLIVATFDGFLGSKADAEIQIRIMIRRVLTHPTLIALSSEK